MQKNQLPKLMERKEILNGLIVNFTSDYDVEYAIVPRKKTNPISHPGLVDYDSKDKKMEKEFKEE